MNDDGQDALDVVMDMFEDTYLSDFRLKRQDYAEACFNEIDWGRVESGLADCLEAQPERMRWRDEQPKGVTR